MRCLLPFALLISACTPPGDPMTPRPDAGPGCQGEVVMLPTIDFGCQTRGSTTLIALPDAGAELGAFSDLVFQVTPSGVLFSPVEERNSGASIPFVRDGCVVARQPVIGNGVDAVLRWAPAVVEFGYVSTGRTRRERVTFQTCSTVPIELTDLATREGVAASAVFGVDAGSSVVVPKAMRAADGTLSLGEVAVEVSFSPAELGPRQGQFVARARVDAQPMLAVPLRGVGGGPVFSANPTQLDFGAVTTPTTRVVTVTNAGTQPGPPDPRAHLFLGIDGLPPYFELTPANCGTVTLSAYDPNVGVSAGQSVSLTVELAPAAGPRTCTLRVFSNDPEQPVTEISITAL